MWRKGTPDHKLPTIHTQSKDFKGLLRYITNLADHKLGYPVSLLTYLGIVDNKVLGINPGSLANILLNNVGDPFKDSETSLMEVKKHEREIIAILEEYYGLHKNQSRGYVTTGGTEGNFAGLWWSKRYLINSALPTLIKYDDAYKQLLKEEQDLTVALTKISTHDFKKRCLHLEKILEQKNAIAKNRSIVQQQLTPTVFYTKGHTHYSIPKIAEILRLNIRVVEGNSDGSMNLDNFYKELLLHNGAHPNSPVVVIANVGTTITGAIDDVPGIKKLLEKFKTPAQYTIHLDGALTGFVLPILKPFGEVADYFGALGVNTLAVSAHKYPGLSQPCGIILARREFFDKAFEKSERSIDYVGNIIDVTITGSRSGLNVLMFYNALCALGMDKGKEFLTSMVNQNLSVARYLYNQLVSVYGHEQVSYLHHFNVMFPKPSLTLAKKYQLMLTGDRATICVLMNVSKELIDQFIADLKQEKESAMASEASKGDYTIQTLTDQYVKSTVELFTKSFCDSEPITKHLGIQYSDYEPFTREVVQKAANDGLSKIAIDKQGKVIACCIAEDLSDPFYPKLSHYPKLKPILSLLEDLSRPFFSNKTFIKGKIAHIWIAAVDPDYRGLHISTDVDMSTAEMLARKGYGYAYAEFTNDKSERVINNYKHFQLLNRIKYDDYTLENQKPFKGVNGAAASYVIVIRPGINLESLETTYRTTEQSHT